MGKRALIATAFAGFALLWISPASGEIYYQIDEQGLAHFTNSPTISGFRLLQPGVLPRSSRLTSASMEELIEAYGAEHGLDPALIRAVIQVESNFNHRAISHKGAQGLMQLMPATIWRLSVGDAYDPHENIGAGVRYLRELVDLFQGDLTLALAAYNAGSGAVARSAGIPRYSETQNYVRRITNLYYGGVDLGPAAGAFSRDPVRVQRDARGQSGADRGVHHRRIPVLSRPHLLRTDGVGRNGRCHGG